ncbi:MAG: DUF4252 domain-containing protein [Melioribacteraceae bacterium]|nr:DUF4252 domain-containing protein [Melioribacteraceae bacterium]
MKTKFSVIVSLLLIFSSSLFAQKGDYSKYAGYVDFGNLSAFETGEEVTEVLIEEHLLRMVAKLAIKEEPELSSVLDGIKLIKVHSFEISEENFTKLSDKTKKIENELMNKGWDRIVRVKSKDELVNVFIKTVNEDKIEGLVVTTVEKQGEAVFVNIVGDIDLETISKLSDKFDIPNLHGLDNHKEEKDEDKK